jgi:hypothetical protein
MYALPWSSSDDRTCVIHAVRDRPTVGVTSQAGTVSAFGVPSTLRNTPSGNVAIESVMSRTQPYTVSNCSDDLASTEAPAHVGPYSSPGHTPHGVDWMARAS